MTSGRKTVTAFLTVICGLILVVVDLILRWSVWTWPAVALFVVSVPLLSAKAAACRANPVPLDLLPHLPLVPVERRDHRVSQVALPNLWDDYDFRFTAIVRWCPTGDSVDEPIINPAGLAIDAILARARAITEKREPGRASLVQHELNGALGRMQRDVTGFLHVMAEAVALTLSDHDQERLDRLAAVRKDKAVWEHERKYEQSRREYLGEDVLKDTGSAVVWWLAKNDDQIEKTVNDIGLLAQLSSAARNEDVPECFRHLVPASPAEYSSSEYLSFPQTDEAAPWQTRPATAADHFEAFLDGEGITEDDPQRALLVGRVADAVAACGRQESADELRRRFDSPDTPAGEGSEPDSSWPGAEATDS
ncbi:hypothetical protein [Kitasatospora kifunensis]|uniref:Uncharacterized protein n=1 Tax=Kitasatospora kifunensis TaxID=58351 RepID=A0A7W7VT79_KITKI|nr:hypothetical protein [Kitasatospora kifunensis]MBB4921991.1 hypothetical protein [Kitasatospora kifunensis]